jgi:hypothetical protein
LSDNVADSTIDVASPRAAQIRCQNSFPINTHEISVTIFLTFWAKTAVFIAKPLLAENFVPPFFGEKEQRC